MAKNKSHAAKHVESEPATTTEADASTEGGIDAPPGMDAPPAEPAAEAVPPPDEPAAAPAAAPPPDAGAIDAPPPTEEAGLPHEQSPTKGLDHARAELAQCKDLTAELNALTAERETHLKESDELRRKMDLAINDSLYRIRLKQAEYDDQRTKAHATLTQIAKLRREHAARAIDGAALEPETDTGPFPLASLGLNPADFGL